MIIIVNVVFFTTFIIQIIVRELHVLIFYWESFCLFYKFCEEELHNPEIGFYTAYGIEAIDSHTGGVLKKASDLFLSIDEAEAFAKLLNECKPELVHFEELCQSAVE